MFVRCSLLLKRLLVIWTFPMYVHVLSLTGDKCAVCLCVRVRSVDCLYKPSVWLDHNFEACILAPQQSVDVKFSFYPRQPMKYKDAVTFELNGISRQIVEFTGEGTELQVATYVLMVHADCVHCDQFLQM